MARFTCFESLENRRLMSAVTGFDLFNTTTGQAISGYTALPYNDTINLASLPTTHFSIRADVDTNPGSVLFALDGNSNYHVENSAPYILDGDTTDWNPSVGSHTFTATPYSGVNASGTAGTSRTLILNFTNSSSSSSSSSSTPPPTSGFSHVYTVSSSGPYKTISSAAAVAGPGDEVLIEPGTYHESITLPRSGTSGKPITFAAATAGSVIIDGTGFNTVINGNLQQYITLDGLDVEHCNNPNSTDPAAVSVFSNWIVENTTVELAAGTGINVTGSYTNLLNDIAQSNGRAGMGGADSSYILEQNCTTRYNNTAGDDPDVDAGAGKWVRSDHITLDGVISYNNAGPGLWFDYNDTNITVENCQSYNNTGVAHSWSGNGIRIEVSDGPFLIQNNQFWGNTGSQVDIEECENVTVTGNTLTGTNIGMKDWDRGAQYAIKNISITHNVFNDTTIYTEADDWYTNSGTTKNITIDYNTYNTTVSYLWGTTTYTGLSSVRSVLGFEAHGQVG
jgi:Right handed beta helix region